MLSRWLGEIDPIRSWLEQEAADGTVVSLLNLRGELIHVQRPDTTVLGFSTLAPQLVFVTQRGTGEVYGEKSHTTTITSEKIVLVIGDLTLDIDVDDKFLYRGQYYQIHHVDRSYSERIEAYAKTQN